jgi:glycosyltransferase involved in cell wall biosynthesis
MGIRPPYLLAVGTVQPRKNLVRLIQAFARLRSEGHDLRLVIAGRAGWLAESTLAAPAASGVASHVLFTGHLPDDVIPLLMNHAALVAQPSLYEGLGMPALEALACGAPLVYADVAALPEVVGDAGFPCDPTSVESMTQMLRWAVTDEPERARRRERGLALASRYTWERTAAATLATLRQALAQPQARHGRSSR